MAIHGPDLSQARERAKTLVMRHFVDTAEADGTPPTLRALYVMKAQEAALVLAGGASAMIEAEAALRGVTPGQLAQTISDMARASQDLEIQRMTINVGIETAQSTSDIVNIIEGLGLVFTS